MAQFLPPTASNLPEWIRKAAGVINLLNGRLGTFGSSTAYTASFTASENDYLMLVDATSGAATVTLPVSSLGKAFIIKRMNAGANAVTIDPDGAETIDGAATRVLTVQYESVSLIGIAGGWAVV